MNSQLTSLPLYAITQRFTWRFRLIRIPLLFYITAKFVLIFRKQSLQPLLRQKFTTKRVISCYFIIAWQPWSPDLILCDFCLWNYFKCKVYLEDVSDLVTLKDNISGIVWEILQTCYFLLWMLCAECNMCTIYAIYITKTAVTLNLNWMC